MFPLEIRLSGKFRLLQNERQLECFSSAKAKELFCYLLLYRDQAHSREILASLLWSGCTTAQPKKYFRQALWQLQQILRGASPARVVHALEVEGESLRNEALAAEVKTPSSAHRQSHSTPRRVPLRKIPVVGLNAAPFEKSQF